VHVADKNEGLAGALVRVTQFAQAWLGGGSPPLVPEFEMQALPDRYAGQVCDDAGDPVPLDGAVFRWVGRAGLWFLPPPDASGVQPGVWYEWSDVGTPLTRSQRRPGGRYPRSTALLARYRADPQVALFFTLGPPTRRGVQFWIGMPRGWDAGVASPFGSDGSLGPAFRRAPSVIAGVDHYVTDRPAPPEVDALSRPGAHRARQWEHAHGGRIWGGIVVSVRGYPEVRVLQVAVHEGWIGSEEAYPALQAALGRRRLWARIAPGEEDALINAATIVLITQAEAGQHTPSYPIGRPYLRRLVHKELAIADRSAAAADLADGSSDEWPSNAGSHGPVDARVGLDGEPFDQPATSPWSDRQVRRMTARLAQEAGYPSLTLLTREARRRYEDQATTLLRKRQRLRELRSAIRTALAKAGVPRSRRAVELFVAQHAHDTEDELWAAVRAYLEQRGVGLGPPARAIGPRPAGARGGHPQAPRKAPG
jgi:hypothetical protein